MPQVFGESVVGWICTHVASNSVVLINKICVGYRNRAWATEANYRISKSLIGQCLRVCIAYYRTARCCDNAQYARCQLGDATTGSALEQLAGRTRKYSYFAID